MWRLFMAPFENIHILNIKRDFKEVKLTLVIVISYNKLVWLTKPACMICLIT